MYKTGLHIPNQKTVDSPDVDVKLVGYEEFQCDTCGFKEGRAIAAFTDKLGILSSKKQPAKHKSESKGKMKKEKDRGKRRRQEPR